MKKFDFYNKKYKQKYIEKRLLYLSKEDFYPLFYYQGLKPSFFIENKDYLLSVVDKNFFYSGLLRSGESELIPETFLNENWKDILEYTPIASRSLIILDEDFFMNHIHDFDMYNILKYNFSISEKTKNDIKDIIEIIC
jgi:hypothetical protein